MCDREGCVDVGEAEIASKQLSTLNWEDLLLLLVSVVVSCSTTLEVKGNGGGCKCAI